ncbi:Wzz/FepE/Etk N-terminal domain-containing protein [Gracilimonas halophila]|uniref:Wzz/FepE/Etk N-terminal domain-containing protein n=1 Tax=Gracilimonas halophila TaxID=1834464 RepID=A0ABW5JIL5_9BACT
MSEEKNSNQGDNGDSKPGKKNHNEDFPIQEYRLVPADQSYEGYEEDEIDLIELAKTIWDNRKTIYRFVTVGIILGVLVALLSPKEYVSDATLMPEYNTESGGGASGLLQQYGGLLGISGGGSYNSASNAIRVDLYPQIVQSLSFQTSLMNKEFTYPEYDTTATLYEYFMEIHSSGALASVKRYTIGLPFTILGALRGDPEEEMIGEAEQDPEILSLTKDQMQVVKNLRQRVGVSLNEETGIVTVNVRMPNAKVAAQVAKYTIGELTEYLVEYRTEKVLRDLEFVESQLIKAEERFEEAQLALAEFTDSNQGNLTARARTEQQRLQSEYDVAFNLYNSLTQQYEQARLKVQEETPVFKVLQPVQVPVEDETSGFMILIVFVMLSGIASIGWIFIRQFLENNPFKSE